MSRPPTSNIQVFPAFRETAFFSGEDLTCVLTFKNVAEVLTPSSAKGLGPSDTVKATRRVGNLEEGHTKRNGEGERGTGSEGDPRASENSASGFSREQSTGGSSSDEQSTSKTNGMQRSHGRSQSAVITTTPLDLPLFKPPTPVVKEEPRGIPPLVPFS